MLQIRTTGKSGRLQAVLVILIFLMYSTQEGHCDDDVASSCVKLDADVTRDNVGHALVDSMDTNTAWNYFSTIVEFMYHKVECIMTYITITADHLQTTLTHEKKSSEISDDNADSVKHDAHNKFNDMLNQDFKLNVDKLLSDFLPADEDATDQPEGGEVVFEYPKMEQIKPVKVGHEQSVDIGDETSVKVITLSVNPPIFEIPDFLSNDDCDYIIDESNKHVLHTIRWFATVNNTVLNKEQRISNQTDVLPSKENVAFLTKLQKRAAGLLGVPVKVIKYSQPLVVGQYWPGGFYHSHLDSNIVNADKPCCFHTNCSVVNGKELEDTHCCNKCRMATMMYYLNNVEEGGETAFPFADKSLPDMNRSMQDKQWHNLTKNCEQASVRVKPQKGKAILWYNHFLDKRGYLGAVNTRSYHGGCNVKKGVKWVGLHLVQTPHYRHRLLSSKFAIRFADVY
ncbi:hypothetical protein DPMN_065506 [Dreissena polymorpha]|uniref:Prolyl 4-hydroxylase alpha subunit domain-containing protein n=1 Tax=Dreissena polymorpha TaxID=45954 RepID=A0A9D4BJP0_DREPO|nr:hypothetical protein DPMN_065506 [Dreissena polymorpha]